MIQKFLCSHELDPRFLDLDKLNFRFMPELKSMNTGHLKLDTTFKVSDRFFTE